LKICNWYLNSVITHSGVHRGQEPMHLILGILNTISHMRVHKGEMHTGW
jgi:hypothetical protein